MRGQAAVSLEEVNERAAAMIGGGRVEWVDVVPAREALPALGSRALLHAGPPLEPTRMCGAMRNAACGALVYERWASDLGEAGELADRTTGCRSFVTINEGLGGTLCLGANGEKVIDRLRWIEGTLVPMLKAALVPVWEGRYFEGYGPEDANPVMGDCHISEAAGLGGPWRRPRGSSASWAAAWRKRSKAPRRCTKSR